MRPTRFRIIMNPLAGKPWNFLPFIQKELEMKQIQKFTDKNKIKASVTLCVLFTCFVFVAGLFMISYVDGEPIVYPSKGQSQAQQSKDEGACHQWAIQQTGVDPVKLAEESSSGEVYQRHHSALGGAARGALLGVAVGAIAGDAGKGAAIGAAAGGLHGGMQSRRDLEAQHQATAAAHADQQAQLEKYDRAYSACLEGKGYTVK